MPAVAQTFPLYYLNRGRQRQGIINGSFDVWQRGTLFLLPVGVNYTADRFYYLNNGGSGTKRAEISYVNPGEPPSLENLANAIVLARTGISGEVDPDAFGQRIPGVDYGAGQAVSIGMWLWSDADEVVGALKVEQNFGTGGSPSVSTVTTVATNIQVGTEPTWFEFTLNMPSIVGKTLGDNGDDHIDVYLEFEVNDDILLYTTGWQVNVGTAVLPFQRKSRGEELADCLLFFERQNVAGNLLPSPLIAWDSSHVRANLTFTPKWRPPNKVALSAVLRFRFWKDGSGQYFKEQSWAYEVATETTIQGEFEVTNDPGPKGSVYVWEASPGTPVWIDISSEL